MAAVPLGLTGYSAACADDPESRQQHVSLQRERTGGLFIIIAENYYPREIGLAGSLQALRASTLPVKAGGTVKPPPFYSPAGGALGKHACICALGRG
jgi:hypothetical protein